MMNGLKIKKDKGRNWQFPLIVIGVWILMAIIDVLFMGTMIRDYGMLNPTDALLPPLSNSGDAFYLLGTDNLGRDVFSGIVHGARISLVVSLISISLAFFLGLFIGVSSGYYTNKGIQKNAFQFLNIVFCFLMFSYYLLHLVTGDTSIFDFTMLGIISFAGIGIDRLLGKMKFQKYGLPVDFMVQRLFEIRESIPGLFVILAVVSVITSPSFLTMAILISVLMWINFARHARIETIKVKEEEFVMAAKSTGISDWDLMAKHILPNILPPLLVILAFSIGGVILLESTLSFLGIGVPVEEISWGKILAEAKSSPKAWWLAVFPGLAIFFLLYAFNVLGHNFSTMNRK